MRLLKKVSHGGICVHGSIITTTLSPINLVKYQSTAVQEIWSYIEWKFREFVEYCGRQR